MLILALLVVLAAQPVPQATAQPDWREIGLSVNGRQTSYDAASVVRVGPVSRVRMRFVEAETYGISTVELRCAAYEGRSVGAVTYAPNGREVSRNEMVTPFRAIRIGSFLDTLAQAICGAAQAPAVAQ